MASKGITTILIALLGIAAIAEEVPATCLAKGTCPSAETDNAALLQSSHRHAIQRHGHFGDHKLSACAPGQDVRCPGSGNQCAGDQCCPGFRQSNGLTFPCPSASADFNRCESPDKVRDCLATTTTTTTMAMCAAAASVQCPGSSSMCAGDQCCPGAPVSGGLTFPCPSASRAFNGCQSTAKVADCLPSFCCMGMTPSCLACKAGMPVEAYCEQNPSVAGCGGRLFQSNSSVARQGISPVKQTCQHGDNVRCPGSGRRCAGDQCCPRTGESGDNTFPCPSASPYTQGCETPVKVTDCLEAPKRPCCMANTAVCLACVAGMTEEEYCAVFPRTVGCEANPCCMANTAKCLACAAGMTEVEYCTKNPSTSGCETKMCCMANTAQCLACVADMTEEEYCAVFPSTVGCEANPCCMANTAKCLACAAGMTKEEYCNKQPSTLGCVTMA